MGKIGVLVAILSLICFDILLVSKDNTVCNRTLLYRIGSFDHRFNLGEDEFRESLAQSESIWESALGLNLFQYDSTAKFTINLVFDARQQATIAKENLSHRLERMELSQSNISKSYDKWYETYNNRKLGYENLLSKYKSRLNSYNNDVSYWSNKGSPTRHIYEQLEKEKQNLILLQAKLEQERAYINDIIDMLQSMKAKSNVLLETYKSHIKTYNSLYGAYTRFNQGEYTEAGITIYQFNNTADLILVLAHELGHALGLGHVEAPKAVMHYLMGEQDLDALALMPDDITALKAVCGRN